MTGEPADHALGRSRGGFTTKLNLLCDASGRPAAALRRRGAGQGDEAGLGAAVQLPLVAGAVLLLAGQGRPQALTWNPSDLVLLV